MEADPDFSKEVIGIDGEDVLKAEKELIQYNSELRVGFFHLCLCLCFVTIIMQRTWRLRQR